MFQYPVTIMFWFLSWLRSRLATNIVRGQAIGQCSTNNVHRRDKDRSTHAKLNLITEDEKGKENEPSSLQEEEKDPSKQKEQKRIQRVRYAASRGRQRGSGADAPPPDKTHQGDPSSLTEQKGNRTDHTLPFHTLASDEDIHWYLENLAKIPALEAAEEQACLEQIAADPCSNETEEARHRLIEGSLYRVVRLACRYQPFGLSIADLIQEGNLTLVMAARRFDPQGGQHFRAFATRAIYWALHRMVEAHLREQHLREMDRVVIAPLGATTFKALMRNDLDEEAMVFDLPEERFCSLDVLLAEMDTDDVLPDDLLSARQYETVDKTEPGQEDCMLTQERSAVLTACLENLTCRERQVILLRFGLIGDHDHTLEEVGRILRITREAVRQTEKRAIRKLRHPSCARRLCDVL